MFPNATRAYPVTLPDGSEHPGTVFLDQVIDHPGWEVGAYTYASDFAPPADWAGHLAPYFFVQGPVACASGGFARSRTGCGS